jgi:glyoxylate carboligase
MHRKTHYTETHIKPMRVYEEMNKGMPRDTVHVTPIGLSQIAGAQFRQPYGHVLVNNSDLGVIRHPEGRQGLGLAGLLE